ncbi:4-(cytidine 5'-diphospho)-2-C-methyl-D-erythritol kinase [Thermodesulfatator autotrophicus]|uniref:4-diphosphocytidyl-2-C-methyl-D-erythritol kinase n=1 Tax=Thermodesulfatator autotrophicus TaxID=1795632 RepID=A0A177E7R6_9BACT|nr:4-(cytidine 5'-diphospho)-2-C-methyl-D-erythritol kinase [Thermodesulfatator autotrophicus]OAG27828.1 hypothetical protein TH606_04665 [Thermodesulfatator autotrophicus]
MASKFSLFAPAKINLVLKIIDRREDGYHELYTIFQKITFGDRLTLSFKEKGLSLEVKGESVPSGPENLCLKAIQLFVQKTGLSFGLHIELQKNVPPGTGLGGGSSDAAVVLRWLNEKFKALSERELLVLAKKLGADVPFFVSSFSTALARGIGEKLSPWPTFPAWYVILIPEIKVSTKWAYENLRLTIPQLPPNYDASRPLWEQGLVNDFEKLVFKHYPELKKLKERLLDLGAEAALLSGSGGALFGVFKEEAQAVEAAGAFSDDTLKKVEVATNYYEKTSYKEG